MSASDLAFLIGGDRGVTTVVADDDGVHAASVFAMGAEGAFHIMQLTSERGRMTNAGHLAFWSGVRELAERGAGTIDLGAAVDEGQARFKMNWGAVAAPARVVYWRDGDAR